VASEAPPPLWNALEGSEGRGLADAKAPSALRSAGALHKRGALRKKSILIKIQHCGVVDGLMCYQR
jgi:hypothetical protein